jgi:hypothetical protein
MREVPLTKGYTAVVDDKDFAIVSQHKWQACVTPRIVYAYRSVRKDGKHGKLYLHRFLLKVEDPKVEVDHRDHDGLNCQRYNLRTGTKADNQHNRRMRNASVSGYKGVSRNRGKWIVQIHGKCVGRFTEVIAAAKAYDTAAVAMYGEYAHTNFGGAK